MTHRNNLKISPFGNNYSNGKRLVSNLGVVERQSGSQAEHLADWSLGEAVLLDSHWHGTGSGFGHWPRPELHYGRK